MREDVAAFINYRFEKISRLNGESKTNEVWHVKIRATGQFAVMKIIKSDNLPCAELRDMVNPILAKIFYCAQDESETVIVEEYVAGETLSEILRDRNLFAEDAAQDFLLQMCDGLKILHAAGIVHRDIKPSNLIRQFDGRIKLIDFDAARIFKAGKRRDTRHLGTEGYAPPEQFGYGQTDSRSDIYSLGVTAREMLGKNYRGRLEKILAKCTAYDPKYRYQSAEELKAALTYKEVDKKNYGGKILFICAAIIFSTGILYFNSTEEKNIPAEIPPSEEKFSVQEKPVENVPEVQPKPKDEKKFNFGEIVLPEISLPPNFQPSFPNQENITPSTFEPSFPEQVPQNNFVRAKYFFNGKQINDWQNNLIEDLEVDHVVYIPFEVWHNNFYPLNGTLEVRIENFSAENFAPQLEITFDDDGNFQTQTLSGNILNFGQTYKFTIPLNKFRVENSEGEEIGSADLHIKISGAAQIIGSNATIIFMLVPKNSPIPKH